MAIEHLSHSTATDYRECGEKVRLRKIEKIQGGPSWSLIGGSLVHSFTEAQDWYDFGRAPAGPLEWTKETFDAAIAAEEEKSGTSRDEWRASGRASEKWPNKENYDWWLLNGPVMVKNWKRFLDGPHYQIALLDDQPAIEVEFETLVGGVKTVGYIDRVLEHIATKELVVVDLKSGTRDPMSADQLGLYSIGLKRSRGVETTWGTYFMNRKGTTTLHYDLRKYHDGRMDYEYAATWRGIQAGVFLPKVGPLCGSCGVREYCRAVDGPYADQVKNYTKEQAYGD